MRKEDILSYVETNARGTVLSFPERGPWGDSNYRGNFSGWIPAAIINRYECQSVSEIFAGSGTTSDLCKDLQIPYVGIDLNPNPVRENIFAMDILDENAELPSGFYKADLQILHPPYPSINKIQYSGKMWKDTNHLGKSDIQNMDWTHGMFAVNKAVMRGYAAMPAGAYQAVVVGDVRRRANGKSIFKSMFSELAIPGKLMQILIKMQHNTVSGRNNFYGHRNFFLIEHEFVVIIKKPSGYEIAYVVPQKYRMDIRDSKSATWTDVVYTVLQNLHGIVSLNEIYDKIEGHEKTRQNIHWKEKVRQILQMLERAGLAIHHGYGKWSVA